MTLAGIRRLTEVLIEGGWVSRELVQEAESRGQGGSSLAQYLLEGGYLTEEVLAQARARQYGLPYLDPAAVEVEVSLLKRLPPGLVKSGAFLPFRRGDGRLALAVADPGDLPLLDELRLYLGTMEIVVASPIQIRAKLQGVESAHHLLQELSQDFGLSLVTEAEEQPLSLDRVKEDQSPIIKLVDTIILNALDRRASDIHLEGTERNLRAKYRIDGMLYPAMEPLDRRYQDAIVSRIKIMAELNIAERRVPQDGRFKLRLKEKMIDFRVSVMPSDFGEAVVIRILDKEAITAELSELKLERLGFPEGNLKCFRRNVHRPHGMILVTGPTGSGKTTTLYAAISEINHGQDKIITIEDPIEYQLQNVVQIPVNEKKGLTFARGLRSILRHDPDKIMVGEIRDPETAQIAVQAALTGHLVFTTVHANNIIDVIGRLIHMGLEPYNFVSALNCILTQRLVRLICAHCKVQATPSPTLLEESGLTSLPETTLSEGKGCPECLYTGYRGRTGIFELVEITDRIQQAILDRRPATEIRAVAHQEGTTSLRQAALTKVYAGLTTLQEINRVTFAEG
ncbi:MAG: GspE/PulE family protein [Candidatus Methylomirabilales bacterium]